MEVEIILQIVLVKPPKDVDYGVQKGSGNIYETIQKQRSKGTDLSFKFPVTVKGDLKKDTMPKFSGPIVHGPTGGKFVYVDIGTCAGQVGSAWSRRLKVPLYTITWKNIDELIKNPKLYLQTIVPGTAKDGGPNCATVKPFDGWQVGQ